ncbi:MAG: RNA polymerase sigma factor [Thermoanaerobaculia bacterium]
MPFLAYSSRRQRKAWREASDRELLKAIQRNDEAAFDQLIERKAAPLVQVALRIVGDREEARDIVQLAFLRVWEKRQRFEDRWSPNTWLYRITTNLAIDHLRFRQSRQRRVEPVRRHLRRVADSRQSVELSALQQTEVTAIFQRLVSCLSERQRLVFVLRGVEGLDSREVAEILGCRTSTVRNHLFAARKKLRKELLRRYPEYARGIVEGGGEEEGR